MTVTLTPSASAPQYPRLAGLSWLHFLNDGAANYLPGVLPAVLLALHQDVGLAGTIMAALLIGQAIQTVTGWWADRIGGSTFIVLGVLGSSVGGALVGFAPSVALLIPVLVVIGLSNSLFHPQALAGARSLSGHRRGFGMALFLVGGEIGRGIWPLLASLVVVNWGLRYLWLLALPALISVSLLTHKLPRQARRHPQAQPIAWRQHRGPLTKLVAFAMLRALTIFGAVTYLPVLWQTQGHSLVGGASLITVMLVVGIIGNVGGGHLADLIGRRPVITGSSVFGAALLAGFLSSHGWWQWALLGLLGIALFATLPLTILIGQDIFPENRSLGSGLAVGFSNGLAAIALAALGPLASIDGPEAVLWLLACAMLVAAVVSLWLPRGDQRA